MSHHDNITGRYYIAMCKNFNCLHTIHGFLSSSYLMYVIVTLYACELCGSVLHTRVYIIHTHVCMNVWVRVVCMTVFCTCMCGCFVCMSE